MSSQRLMRGSKGSKVGETEHKQWGSVCVCVGGGVQGLQAILVKAR